MGQGLTRWTPKLWDSWPWRRSALSKCPSRSLFLCACMYCVCQLGSHCYGIDGVIKHSHDSEVDTILLFEDCLKMCTSHVRTQFNSWSRKKNSGCPHTLCSYPEFTWHFKPLSKNLKNLQKTMQKPEPFLKRVETASPWVYSCFWMFLCRLCLESVWWV